MLHYYPNVKIIASEKAILFMRQFGYHVDDRYIEVKEGDSISFGKHEFTFVEAPMVPCVGLTNNQDHDLQEL